MKKIIIYSTALYVIVLLPFIVIGKEAPKTFNISLSVSCDDDNIKSEIKNYVSRELRSLGDVLITSVDNEYELSIVVVSSIKAHITLASLMLSKYDIEGLYPMLDEKFRMFKDAPFSPLPDNLYFRPKHYVITGYNNNIPEICRQLVLFIDEEVLQGVRGANEQWRAYEKYRKE